MKQVIICILVILVTLSACRAPQAPDPTSIPKPTWTRWPMAEFKVCAFFEGEIVKGGFAFRDSNTREIIYNQLSIGPECLVDAIVPGEYMLNVHICDPEHKCGPPAGCCYLRSNNHPVTLTADDVFKMDIDFYRTDFLEAYPNWSE